MLPMLPRNLQRSENPGREDFLRQRLLSRGVLESPTRNLSSRQIRLLRLQRYLSHFRDRLGDAPIGDDRERYVSGANFVHGDLSAYNILVHDGAVWLIDFPQAVDPRTNANACGRFRPHVDRLCHWFERFGVQADAARLSADLWQRFLTAQL
jgi:hypothetical protein